MNDFLLFLMIALLLGLGITGAFWLFAIFGDFSSSGSGESSPGELSDSDGGSSSNSSSDGGLGSGFIGMESSDGAGEGGSSSGDGGGDGGGSGCGGGCGGCGG